MDTVRTEKALERAKVYLSLPENKARLDEVEGSRQWVVLQVAAVAGQLLDNMPRLGKSYDLSAFAEVFGETVDQVNVFGATGVLDQLVETTDETMALIINARPIDYEKYSTLFLRDIFRIIYNLDESK